MNHDEVHRICEKYNIENYTINIDGSIDVNGNVFLYGKGLRKLPLRFNYVSGYFNCCFNKLKSLKGAPKKIGDDFSCYKNKLVLLEGAPKEVGGHFHCQFNKLISLKGAPLKVGGHFHCFDNRLKTLEGAPKKVGGHFECFNNITKLDYNSYKKSIERINKIKQL